MPSGRRYTEAEFRAAVADPDIQSIADLCRALGIAPRGANYESVRGFAHDRGIDVTRLELPPTHRRLVDGVPESELRRAVANSTSLASTLRKLGLADVGAATSALRARLDDQGIETSHFTSWRPAAGPGRHTYTDDDLRAALGDPGVDSFPALCERLGLRPLSNTYRRLRERARALGLRIPHSWSKRGPRSQLEPFADIETIRKEATTARSLAEILRAIDCAITSQNYLRLHLTIDRHGIALPAMPPPEQRGGAPARPLAELLVRGSRTRTSSLRERLVEAGIKDRRCEACGLDTWLSQPIPLELDHVDGDRWNNELANLRLLCPNCHALTPTYRGRNIGRANGSSITEGE